MKKLILIALLISVHFVVQAQDIEYIISRYKESTNKIQKIEYQAHKIDTFSSGETWNNKGYALIKRDKKDPVFGFSFYGVRYDINMSTIYQDESVSNINI